MLGKLMKYEIKASARVFVPLYGAVILLAIINKVMMSFRVFDNVSNMLLRNLGQIPQMLVMVAYIMMIAALFVITLIVMIQRFYKNLLGDEGYLMFTLPVHPWMHIVTKLATSVMWIILTGIVTIASILILTFSFDVVWYQDFFSEVIREYPRLQVEFQEMFGMSFELFMVIMLVIGFIGMIASILQVYAAISIGQLFNKYKLLASFGAYIATNMVMQTIASIILVLIGFGAQNNSFSFQSTMWEVIAYSTFISLLASVAYYIGTHWILTKKLNLE